MGRGKNWTEEEKQYLADNWGSVSLRTIAKNLNRSENAVTVMKVRLGLGAFLDNGEYVSYCQLLQALYGLDSVQGAYRTWRRANGFPIRKKKVNRCTFKIVYLEEFWEWAEENKHLLDFSKMEENALGAEPDWVKQKRKLDYQNARYYTTEPWTDADDRKLDRLVREGKYTIDQLADIFHRKEGAIKRRMYDLCIDVKPPRNGNRKWTDEETQLLLFLRQEGYSFEQIGKRLERSASSCRGKAERLENPEHFYRENRRKREQEAKNGRIYKNSTN